MSNHQDFNSYNSRKNKSANPADSEEFNIEKYVSDQKAMRLKLSKGERFTEYHVDMTAVKQEVAISVAPDEKEIYVGF